MPVWAVQIEGCEDETVEAGLLTTEGGALVALSAEGLIVRAWGPGRWDGVRVVSDLPDPAEDVETVLFGVPSH